MTKTKRKKTKRIRKLTKVGGYSYSITLPMDIIKKFGWRERQRVQLEIDEDKEEIRIRDYKE